MSTRSIPVAPNRYLLEIITRQSRTEGDNDIGHMWVRLGQIERGYWFDTKILPIDIQNGGMTSIIQYLKHHKVRGYIRREPAFYTRWIENPVYRQLYSREFRRHTRCGWTIPRKDTKARAFLAKMLQVSRASGKRDWGFYSLNANVLYANNCVSWARRVATKTIGGKYLTSQDKISGKYMQIEKVAVAYELISRLRSNG
jgi:hypothetical protein